MKSLLIVLLPILAGVVLSIVTAEPEQGRVYVSEAVLLPINATQ